MRKFGKNQNNQDMKLQFTVELSDEGAKMLEHFKKNNSRLNTVEKSDIARYLGASIESIKVEYKVVGQLGTRTECISNKDFTSIHYQILENEEWCNLLSLSWISLKWMTEEV